MKKFNFTHYAERECATCCERSVNACARVNAYARAPGHSLFAVGAEPDCDSLVVVAVGGDQLGTAEALELGGGDARRQRLT